MNKQFWIRLLQNLRHNLFSRLDIYFYRELLPNYVLGLLFFTVILMLNELFVLVKFYVEYNVPMNQVLALLMNMIPFILSYTVPLAVLPAYLLSMGRFSMESEIIAMKSCGVSPMRIIRPGIVFGIMISFGSILFTDLVVVDANMNYIKLRAKIIAKKPAVELKEKAFVEIGGYKISFEQMKQENKIDVLYKIHVIDINGRRTIEAEKGRFYTDPENPEHYILKFMNGSISEVNKMRGDDGTTQDKFFVASFRYLTIHTYIALPDAYYSKSPDTMKLIELSKEVSAKSKTTLDQIDRYLDDKNRFEKDLKNLQKELNSLGHKTAAQDLQQKSAELKTKIAGLRLAIKNLDKTINNYRKNLPNYYIMKYYEKFALPLASLAFALLSLSIGMYMPRSGRNEGLGVSVIMMMVFYGGKIGTENLIMKGLLPPWMEWFPFTVFLILGLVLLIKKVRE